MSLTLSATERVQGKIHFRDTEEWELRIKELVKAAGETYSNSFVKFLISAGRFLFHGEEWQITTRRLAGRLGLSMPQVRRYVYRAKNCGIYAALASSWEGLNLKMLVLSVAPAPAEEAPSAPSSRSAPPSPTESSDDGPALPRLTFEERREAAGIAAERWEREHGKSQDRERLALSILQGNPRKGRAPMSNTEALEHLAWKRAQEGQAAAKAQKAEERAKEEEARALFLASEAAKKDALRARLALLPEPERKAIELVALEKLPKGLQRFAAEKGGPDKVSRGLTDFHEAFDRALLEELRRRFSSA